MSDSGPSSSPPPASSAPAATSATSTTSDVVAPPPTSSTATPPASSSPSPSPSPSISSPDSSVSLPPPSSSLPATTSSASPLPTTAPSSTLPLETLPSSNPQLTVTRTEVTQFQPTPSSSEAAVRTASKGFFQNKPAVGATFAIVGLIVAALLFALVTAAIRRRRAKRFDREIAEEAKRAPAPVFLDDDDEYNNAGYSSYGTPQADPYAARAEYPTSDAAHSTSAGTAPANYMYPSGYSDLGFSDVSSQGTYAQPPMDGQYNPTAAYAGYGAAGAYEMTQYAQGQGHTPQQEWGGHQGYVYPGEEGATGYPPMAADALARSKSGARGPMDSSYSGSPPPQADPFAKNVPVPQYSDGYVAQYQTHDGAGAYGGMESVHGHVGGMEDEGEEEEYNDGRRVLKVANE